MQLLFDDWREVVVPSPATLSRARPKVDLAMMHLRRLELSEVGIENMSVQLSFSACELVNDCLKRCKLCRFGF